MTRPATGVRRCSAWAVIGLLTLSSGCGGIAGQPGEGGDQGDEVPDTHTGPPTLPSTLEGSSPPKAEPPSVATPVSGPAPVDPVQHDAPSFEAEPEPSVPSEDPTALRECDDGSRVMVRANEQSAVDALAGCTSLYGLTVSGPLDLRPLAALRRVGLGGLNVGARVASLAGLEGLEVATRLNVYNAALPDLHALSNLRHVEALEVTRIEGPIVDLGGLENVRGIRILRIYNNAGLESLKGLNLSGDFEYVMLDDNPRLSDVSPLSGITSVARDFTFGPSSVETLRLDGLETVLGSLVISDNAALTGLFLGSAVAIGALKLTGNQPITSASFERLAQLGEFVLENNWVIRDVPAFPALPGLVNVRVADNYELISVNGFSALEYANDIEISGNDKLVSIDFGGLKEASSVYIYLNPALDGSSAAAAFAGVTGDRIRIAPAQDTLPMEPCPWTNDGFCDGDPISTWRPGYQLQAMCSYESDPACRAE